MSFVYPLDRANAKESAKSTTAKFTPLPRTLGSSCISFEANELVRHRHSIKVSGRIEPGAEIMVNGDEGVPKPDGSFSLFTKQPRRGENTTTITAQNAKGGFNHVWRPITIQ